jgi:hypothetical protein
MKTIITKNIKLIFSAITIIAGMTACEKYLDHDGTELGVLSPTKIDDTAGAWKTYTH